MTRTALFGDSYIKRQGRFCDHFLGIPGDCSFYGVGGMRTDSINKEALRRLFEFHPHTVCVCLGGNDISTSSTPKKSYEDIIEFVKLLENSGVNTVYVCEIMMRGKFLKTPGLDKKTFDKKRKLINDHLRKKFGQRYLKFSRHPPSSILWQRWFSFKRDNNFEFRDEEILVSFSESYV